MKRAAGDLLAGLVLGAIVLTAALPAILEGRLGQKAYDHRHFHLPLVREWAATWPAVDLRDYNSATGPLYHWLMAGAAQIVGAGTAPETSISLQTVNALFGALAVLLFYRFARATLPPPTALLAALPLSLSPYLVGNSIWLMTDNLSLALVAAAVGSAAFGAARGPRLVKEGVLAALATATRQINPWLLGPIMIGAMLRGEGLRRPLLQAAIALALPLGTLAFFAVLWGGLVPPRFRELHASGTNPAAIGFALTLLAAYGWPLLAARSAGLRELLRCPLLTTGAALGGVAVSAVGPSFASLEAGRNGGWLWRSVAALPTIADRSPIILLGGGVGAVALAALYLDARRAQRAGSALVVLAAFAAFAVAHVANSQIFQRYYDPMVLLTLGWLAACAAPPLGRAPPGLSLGLALVAALQLIFALVAL